MTKVKHLNWIYVEEYSLNLYIHYIPYYLILIDKFKLLNFFSVNNLISNKSKNYFNVFYKDINKYNKSNINKVYTNNEKINNNLDYFYYYYIEKIKFKKQIQKVFFDYFLFNEFKSTSVSNPVIHKKRVNKFKSYDPKNYYKVKLARRALKKKINQKKFNQVWKLGFNSNFYKGKNIDFKILIKNYILNAKIFKADKWLVLTRLFKTNKNNKSFIKWKNKNKNHYKFVFDSKLKLKNKKENLMLKSFNLVNKYKNKNNDIFNYILNNKKLYNYYLNFIYFSKFNNNYLLNNSLIIQNTDTFKDLELKNQKSIYYLNKKDLINYFNNNKI